MGIFDKIIGKQKQRAGPTVLVYIPLGEVWFVQGMAYSVYAVEGPLDCFVLGHLFFDEQKRPGGILEGKVGGKLFAMGAYMGQTLIARLGGRWETDDRDPEGEINIAVCMNSGTVWPVQRVMKRFSNGPEDSLYDYGMILKDMENQAGR